jgi:hypothetical protein
MHRTRSTGLALILAAATACGQEPSPERIGDPLTRTLHAMHVADGAPVACAGGDVRAGCPTSVESDVVLRAVLTKVEAAGAERRSKSFELRVAQDARLAGSAVRLNVVWEDGQRTEWYGILEPGGSTPSVRWLVESG